MFIEAEDRLAVQLGSPVQVGVAMNGTFRLPGGAARVKPECKLVGVRIRRLWHWRMRQHACKRNISCIRDLARDDDFKVVATGGYCWINGRSQRIRHDDHFCVTVGQHVAVVIGGQ